MVWDSEEGSNMRFVEALIPITGGSSVAEDAGYGGGPLQRGKG